MGQGSTRERSVASDLAGSVLPVAAAVLGGWDGEVAFEGAIEGRLWLVADVERYAEDLVVAGLEPPRRELQAPAGEVGEWGFTQEMSEAVAEDRT